MDVAVTGESVGGVIVSFTMMILGAAVESGGCSLVMS